MLFLVHHSLVKELKRAACIMWNISLCQFLISNLVIISSTGFPLKKELFSLSLSFYPIHTENNLTGNKNNLIWMRETEKWYEIHVYIKKKKLICSAFFSSNNDSIQFIIPDISSCKLPHQVLKIHFFKGELFHRPSRFVWETESRGNWLLSPERMFSLRINTALFNLWHHMTW